MKNNFILIAALLIITSSVCLASGKLPGNSIANEKLQRDTMMPVAVVVKNLNPKCSQNSVVNTKVTQSPQGIEMKNGQPVKGYWSELWTVNSCSYKVYVPITFILDETGCTYSINPKEVKMTK